MYFAPSLGLALGLSTSLLLSHPSPSPPGSSPSSPPFLLSCLILLDYVAVFLPFKLIIFLSGVSTFIFFAFKLLVVISPCSWMFRSCTYSWLLAGFESFWCVRGPFLYVLVGRVFGWSSHCLGCKEHAAEGVPNASFFLIFFVMVFVDWPPSSASFARALRLK
jgi:hypothetical protein